MRVLFIVVLLMPLSNADAQILHNNILYFQGTQVEASKRDTVISRDALRVYTKERPNAQIYGYVTAGGLDRNNLQFLLIRCVVKTGREPLRLVLARLSVEMDEPATFSSRGLKSFNVAITDTIPSNELRTYVFKQHLNTITDEAARILWNYYRLSSNPQSFGWTFTPVSVRRLRTN